MAMETIQSEPSTHSFKAETNQLLNILIHSLYSEREVFIRELISNASDALTRMNFTLLTNRDVLDPDRELAIWITADSQTKTITIEDSGIGMTAIEMEENLGTIAHSGARAFLQAAQEHQGNIADMIGQFGVGFYSAFMAAESIEVTSRSYQPEAQAAVWESTGADTYTLRPGEKVDRGTRVIIRLKEDAAEFADESRLEEIIRKHSDYIPFPIYLGSDKRQVNQQTALWRQQPRQVEESQYHDFYKHLTLDPEPPLAHIHLAVDAPVQMYALLFLPTSPEKNIFSPRQQSGLKLYARKVLIQEYCNDLLPDYLQFVEGIVDSEDLPLNVSRETVQSNRVMAQLKKLITTRVIDTLKNMGQEKAEAYEKFWKNFSRLIKQGITTDADHGDSLKPLLRFHSVNHTADWLSLDGYVGEMKPGQQKIYYVLGDDERSLARSPHLEQFRKAGYDVLLLADPVDSFMLLRLDQYLDFEIANAAGEKIEQPQEADPETTTQPAEPLPQASVETLIAAIKNRLGDKIAGVRVTSVLVESPARLVDPQGSLNQEYQRVYRLLNKEFETPKKELEINPNHPLIKGIAGLPAESELAGMLVDQIYEDALLIEGIHPDPAGMIERIQRLMAAALQTSPTRGESKPEQEG